LNLRSKIRIGPALYTRRQARPRPQKPYFLHFGDLDAGIRIGGDRDDRVLSVMNAFSATFVNACLSVIPMCRSKPSGRNAGRTGKAWRTGPPTISEVLASAPMVQAQAMLVARADRRGP